MRIVVTKGQGEGHTALSAFDHALFDAGIHNFNLLPLSSVIPPAATVEEGRFACSSDEWGHRLYLVMVRAVAMVPGAETWAGIGWVQAADGRGLFVEHADADRSKLVDMIRISLSDMVSYRDEEFGEIRIVVSGAKCIDKPACALVAAIYESQGW